MDQEAGVIIADLLVTIKDPKSQHGTELSKAVCGRYTVQAQPHLPGLAHAAHASQKMTGKKYSFSNSNSTLSLRSDESSRGNPFQSATVSDLPKLQLAHRPPGTYRSPRSVLKRPLARGGE